MHYANATDQEITLSFLAEGNKDGLSFTNPGKIAPRAKGVTNFTYTMPYVMSNEVLIRLHPYVNTKKLAERLDIKILNGNLLKN